MHYFSIYVQPAAHSAQDRGAALVRLRLRARQLRLRRRAGAAAAVAAAGDLQQAAGLRLDVRHRLTEQLAATLSYVYEPYRIFDFAFDPSVINSIVQPSSLVLGYMYRPYTAHTAVFGILYYW